MDAAPYGWQPLTLIWVSYPLLSILALTLDLRQPFPNNCAMLPYIETRPLPERLRRALSDTATYLAASWATLTPPPTAGIDAALSDELAELRNWTEIPETHCAVHIPRLQIPESLPPTPSSWHAAKGTVTAHRMARSTVRAPGHRHRADRRRRNHTNRRRKQHRT